MRNGTFGQVCQTKTQKVCESAQSDQILRYWYEETLNPCLSKMGPILILIRLCECVG